ncbi:HNH endonuclease signature motif containing protein [Acidovorax sp. Leaf160]|uniref:HNH endonuclease signature motif containing protein n=1 Tax=Acidovorax sp. Leaf160 TaxID=1736280 RepID=UPI0009E88E79|nr:HNH endonuclease signature motif containing protein [Acidovorax sp. Leaf160]
MAWLYVNGAWPDGQIDHINGNRADNRIANLRVCSNADNGQNRGVNANNRSGSPGVSFHSKAQKWQAHIGIQGVRHALGFFASKEDAAAAYVEAKAQLHQFNPSIRLA